MRADTFKVVMVIYNMFCDWQDKNGIKDNYPEIQLVEDLIKAERFTLFELDDTDYMTDKFEIWNEMISND